MMTFSDRSMVLPFPTREGQFERTIIAFVDLQHEYIAQGRAYALKDTKKCLENCRQLLDTARAYGMTIAHFRLLKKSGYFNQETHFSHWLDEFRPRPNEMVFEREKTSLFSNKAFAAFVKNIRAPEIILVGLSGQQACLASSIDAAHNNYEMFFVKDASASQAIGQYSEQQCHDIVTGIIGTYVQTVSTSRILARMENMQALRTREADHV